MSQPYQLALRTLNWRGWWEAWVQAVREEEMYRGLELWSRHPASA